MNLSDWTLYLMSGIYFIAGILHFIKPKIYKSIIPKYLPNRLMLVYLSGFIEIFLAILLLFTSTRNIAVYGIIFMLMAFLPAHLYMLSDAYKTKIQPWILWARIPFQFILMWWAYQYIIP